ncbi:endonuclease domain protein [Halorubrum virus VOLN27B]|nr:endonuclease domain protein [Halorubrum virus VOLN27B]
MKETDVAYLSGVVDSIGRFRVEIEEDDEYKIGYTMEPTFKLNRSDPETVVFGMLEEYCSEKGIRWEIKDLQSTMSFVVSGADDLDSFFSPLAPYIIQKNELLSIFMGEIVVPVSEGKHLSKQGFYEIVKAMNELYRNDPSINRWKYETATFSNKWRDEIET